MRNTIYYNYFYSCIFTKLLLPLYISLEKMELLKLIHCILIMMSINLNFNSLYLLKLLYSNLYTFSKLTIKMNMFFINH